MLACLLKHSPCNFLQGRSSAQTGLAKHACTALLASDQMPAFVPSFCCGLVALHAAPPPAAQTAVCVLCQQMLCTPHSAKVLRSTGGLVQHAGKQGCSGQSTDSTDSTGLLRNRLLVAANAALVSLTGNPDTHFGLVNEGAAPALVATLQYGKADCISSSHLVFCIFALLPIFMDRHCLHTALLRSGQLCKSSPWTQYGLRS